MNIYAVASHRSTNSYKSFFFAWNIVIRRRVLFLAFVYYLHNQNIQDFIRFNLIVLLKCYGWCGRVTMDVGARGRAQSRSDIVLVKGVPKGINNFDDYGTVLFNL